MKTITIGFSKPINKTLPIYSYLIKWAYKTEYSHVFIKFHSSSLNRDIVYESVGPGVRFIGTTIWSKHAQVLKEYPILITDEQYIDIMTYCVDNAGIEYGVLQSIGVYLAKVLKLKKNPLSFGNDKEICSEMVARVLELANISLNMDFDIVAPRDIEEALINKYI